MHAALALPPRREANRARDGARHPYETLRLFGIAPTLKVLELTSGGARYTEMLAPCLPPRGQFAVAHFAEEAGSDGRRRARNNFELRLAKQPELYDRVQIGRRFSDLGPAGSDDRCRPSAICTTGWKTAAWTTPFRPAGRCCAWGLCWAPWATARRRASSWRR